MTAIKIHNQGRLRPPPVLKAKTGVVKLPVAAKLSLGETYITAQAQAAPSLGAQLASQAATLKQAHDTVVQKIANRKAMMDSILVADGEIVSAIQDLDAAILDFQSGAVKASNNDVILLQTLAVTPVATTRSKKKGPPGAPENLRLSEGPVQGSLVAKHSRPPACGSFAVEYKLEPSKAEDPWLSPVSLQSRFTEHQINDLPPGQLVRVRVHALGDGWGPYSVEVVGRAR